MSAKNKPLVRLCLDSGAFSAWLRGEKLDIKGYIRYVKELQKYFAYYVSLDDIPGAPGVQRSKEQLSAAAELSYKNHQIMKDAGLSPIPVLHYGESIANFERYLKDGETHIGVGTLKDPLTDHNTVIKLNFEWLDQIFSLITTKNGRVTVKTHGFGVTKPLFLVRYPWATVDSTTWSLNSGYGSIFVPAMGRGGKPNYQQAIGVHLSDVALSGTAPAHDFGKLGPVQQQWIVQCIEAAGVTLTQARNLPDARRRVTLRYYMQLAASLHDNRFRARKGQSTEKPLTIDQPEIIFSTSIGSKEFSQTLTEVGANNRLLSYYETRKRSPEQLIEYVTTGQIASTQRRNTDIAWTSEAYRNRRRKTIIRQNARG